MEGARAGMLLEVVLRSYNIIHSRENEKEDLSMYLNSMPYVMNAHIQLSYIHIEHE